MRARRGVLRRVSDVASGGRGEPQPRAASSLSRRRLPVVRVRLHMSETLREAVTLIEQGHVRVGPDVVTDPAFLVTRPLEDFITWTDSSKIKRKVRAAWPDRTAMADYAPQDYEIYWHQSEWD